MLPTRSQLQALTALSALAIGAGYILWSGSGLIADFFKFPAQAITPDGPMSGRQMVSLIAKAFIFFALLTAALTLPAGVLIAWLNRRGTPLGPIINQAKADTVEMLDGRARRDAATKAADALQQTTPAANAHEPPRRL